MSSVMLAASLLVCSTSFAQDAKDVSEARAAAERWMGLMDAEDFSAAWNISASGIRNEMPKLGWNMLASATHLPLGDFKSRTFKGSTFKKAPADKPGNDAITFEYVARYANNPKVNETVTSVHEKDGVWRVSGYSYSDEKK